MVKTTGHSIVGSGCFDVRGSDGRSSDPIARLPDEEKKGRDHGDQDKHPVLAFETENRKMLDEKLHRFRSCLLCRISVLFVQDRRFGGVNILFLYF
jgi:hypothetical protein